MSVFHWINFLETKNEYYPDFEKYLNDHKSINK